MTAHDHDTLIPGCYRCELGQDEALAALAEEYWEEEIEPTLGVGLDSDVMRWLKMRYVSDIRLNPVAIEQLNEWWAEKEAKELAEES